MKRKCYCSGGKREDGSPILCVNCEYDRVSKLLKESKPLSVEQIKADFIDEQYIDDYTTGKAIYGFSCKLCFLLERTKAKAIKHFQREHNV